VPRSYDWTERNPSEGRRCFVVRQVDEVAETLSALRDNDAGFDAATKVRINKIDQDIGYIGALL
jgi:hypothetical protein